jgi:AsmA-like C-terminal region
MNTAGWATRHRRLILCVGAGLIVSWYGILVAAYVLVPTLKRAVQARAVDVLRREFGSDVRFQSFDVTLFPRVHIVAGGLLIGNDRARPLIQAGTADATSALLPWRIRTLRLTGLSLHIPTAKGPSATTPKPLFTIAIDEIVAERAQLEILPSAGQQTPLHFELANLRVNNFSPTRAANFSALAVSSQPQAQIDISGRVGPWNSSDPGATGLEGAFKMPRGDLATLPGLKGALYSQGRFEGTVKRIEISGDAEASEFGLGLSGRPDPLHASFQALLDASDGSASIPRMNGFLRSSAFVASGFVRNIQDDRLRDIVLNVSLSPGRLEDVLPLAVKSKASPISGALRVRAKLEILPGDREILNRLRLDADFAAGNARFSSLNLRERLRKVSRKAQGHPNNPAAGSSLAKMRGHVRLDNGTAEFSSLVFDLEGSSARLNGSYQLASERLDLHGQLSMEAKLSQTARGPKAFLLKAADRHFRSKRGGSRVAVRITGPRSDPRFGVGPGK